MARGLLAVLLLMILTVVTIGIFVTGIAGGDDGMVRLSLSFGTFWALFCIVLVFYLTRARPELTP